jgi:hypothetical protein
MLILLMSMGILFAQDFQTEAKSLVGDLKSNLVKNLTEKIQKDGVEKAIPFCHENVKPIAKSAAGDRINKYAFGRTSHKIRNPENVAQDFLKDYIKKYQGTFLDQEKLPLEISGVTKDGKKFYAEPLYVGAQCIVCHGEKLSPQVASTIQKLYPNDQATGFKPREFRGFIWVKEK